MRKTISAVQARQRFGELLEQVYYRGDQIIIERAGKPMAVILPLDEFEAWLRQRDKDFTALDRARAGKGRSSAVVERKVTLAVREVRGRRAYKAARRS